MNNSFLNKELTVLNQKIPNSYLENLFVYNNLYNTNQQYKKINCRQNNYNNSINTYDFLINQASQSFMSASSLDQSMLQNKLKTLFSQMHQAYINDKIKYATDKNSTVHKGSLTISCHYSIYWSTVDQSYQRKLWQTLYSIPITYSLRRIMTVNPDASNDEIYKYSETLTVFSSFQEKYHRVIDMLMQEGLPNETVTHEFFQTINSNLKEIPVVEQQTIYISNENLGDSSNYSTCIFNNLPMGVYLLAIDTPYTSFDYQRSLFIQPIPNLNSYTSGIYYDLTIEVMQYLQIESINYNGYIEFQDENNLDQIRPETITVTLHAYYQTNAGNNVDTIFQTYTCSEDNDFSYSITNLPKTTVEGFLINYYLTGEDVPGYHYEQENHNLIYFHEVEKGNIQINISVLINNTLDNNDIINDTYTFYIEYADDSSYNNAINIPIHQGTGSYTLFDLRTGEYTIYAMTTDLSPSVVISPSDTQTITLTKNQSNTINFNYNYEAQGSLTVVASTIPTNTRVSGTFSYLLTGPSYPNGTNLTITMTRGRASNTTITNLLPGEYTLIDNTQNYPSSSTYTTQYTSGNATFTIQQNASIQKTFVYQYTEITPVTIVCEGDIIYTDTSYMTPISNYYIDLIITTGQTSTTITKNTYSNYNLTYSIEQTASNIYHYKFTCSSVWRYTISSIAIDSYTSIYPGYITSIDGYNITHGYSVLLNLSISTSTSSQSTVPSYGGEIQILDSNFTTVQSIPFTTTNGSVTISQQLVLSNGHYYIGQQIDSSYSSQIQASTSLPLTFDVASDGPPLPRMSIFNTYTPSTINVTGSLIWVDDSDIHKVRPDSVTITLYADGAPVSAIPTWRKPHNRWQYKYSNLSQYSNNGSQINYTIDISPIEHYDISISGRNITCNLILQEPNQYTIISGTITWNDNDNSDGARPTNVTVTLLRDGSETDSRTVTAGTNWSYSFDHLPVDDGYGNIYFYEIRGSSVRQYYSRINGFDITYIYFSNTPPPPPPGGDDGPPRPS